MQLYVEANSKKAANEALKTGSILRGEHHTPWESVSVLSIDWPHGAHVKIFSKRVNGTPYAKAYGTVKRVGDVVTIK